MNDQTTNNYLIIEPLQIFFGFIGPLKSGDRQFWKYPSNWQHFHAEKLPRCTGFLTVVSSYRNSPLDDGRIDFRWPLFSYIKLRNHFKLFNAFYCFVFFTLHFFLSKYLKKRIHCKILYCLSFFCCFEVRIGKHKPVVRPYTKGDRSVYFIALIAS